MVVCGWSAAWDGALRNALYRAKSRRFTTYWAVQRDGEEYAQGLIVHRRAERIQIADADAFFSVVKEQVESLQEFTRPHPLSTEAAVASLKRYLSEPRYRIRLSDLVDGVVKQVVEATSGEAFANRPLTDTASATGRVRRYEGACSTLLALATVAGYWADEGHFHLWQRALSRLGTTGSEGGYEISLGLRRYPAALLLYALGIGAVEANRLRFLRCLLETSFPEEYHKDKEAVDVLPPFRLFGGNGQIMRVLEGMRNMRVPLNDWMHEVLKPHASRVIADKVRYTVIFDKLEILIALRYIHRHSEDPQGTWPPRGAFGYREQSTNRILQQIEESLLSSGNESPFVKCGIFGDTAKLCGERLTTLRTAVVEWGWGHYCPIELQIKAA